MDEGDFPAGATTPGQAESRSARAALDAWLTARKEAEPAWVTIWRELCAEWAPVIGADGELALNARGAARTRRRWDWRKALYIAWASVPKSQREPKTLDGLVDLLGLASAGTIRNWRREDPEIGERIAALPRALLCEHVADVYAAMIAVATTPDYHGFQDRKLLLELTDEYRASLTLEERATAVQVYLPDNGRTTGDGA